MSRRLPITLFDRLVNALTLDEHGEDGSKYLSEECTMDELEDILYAYLKDGHVIGKAIRMKRRAA